MRGTADQPAPDSRDPQTDGHTFREDLENLRLRGVGSATLDHLARDFNTAVTQAAIEASEKSDRDTVLLEIIRDHFEGFHSGCECKRKLEARLDG